MICLDPKPHLLTKCEHYFHPHCLLAWFKKSQNCPLCKRGNFRTVRVYCKGCEVQFVDVSMRQLNYWINHILEHS